MGADRPRRENLVSALTSADGRTIFDIVQRAEGTFGFYEDCLVHDEENQSHYWQVVVGDPESHFGSVEDAEREIKSRYFQLF